MSIGESIYQDRRSEAIAGIVAQLDAGRIPVELTNDLQPTARMMFPKRLSETVSGTCAVCSEPLSQWQSDFCSRHWDWTVIDFVLAIPIVDYHKELADELEAKFRMLHIDVERVQESVLFSGHSLCDVCGDPAPFVESLRNHRGRTLKNHSVCEQHAGLSDGI